jgi:hypothetical protein
MLTYLIHSSYTFTLSRCYYLFYFQHFTDGRTPWRVISPSEGLYLNTGQHKYRINTYTYQSSMPCGIRTYDPGFRESASDRPATVTGPEHATTLISLKPERWFLNCVWSLVGIPILTHKIQFLWVRFSHFMKTMSAFVRSCVRISF